LVDFVVVDDEVAVDTNFVVVAGVDSRKSKY